MSNSGISTPNLLWPLAGITRNLLILSLLVIVSMQWLNARQVSHPSYTFYGWPEHWIVFEGEKGDWGASSLCQNLAIYGTSWMLIVVVSQSVIQRRWPRPRLHLSTYFALMILTAFLLWLNLQDWQNASWAPYGNGWPWVFWFPIQRVSNQTEFVLNAFVENLCAWNVLLVMLAGLLEWRIQVASKSKV